MLTDLLDHVRRGPIQPYRDDSGVGMGCQDTVADQPEKDFKNRTVIS